MIGIIAMFTTLVMSGDVVPTLSTDEKLRILKSEEKYIRKIIPATTVLFMYGVDATGAKEKPSMLIQIYRCPNVRTYKLTAWINLMTSALDAKIKYVLY